MCQDEIEVAAVGVCNENLSEILSTNVFHDACNSLSIQFVKDVVQQQQWHTFFSVLFEKNILCQFHRDEKSLGLSLRRFSLHWITIQFQHEFVLVNAVERLSLIDI